jgi:hypothetical protein
MAVIRAKVKAGASIMATRKKRKSLPMSEIQDLLPFAMWHVERVPIEDISRLLLLSESDVAASIIHGAYCLSLYRDSPTTRLMLLLK